MDELKYPIGQFTQPELISKEIIKEWVGEIASLPEKIKLSLANMTDAQLDTPYRPNGWTVRQLVHHIADSHMNAFIRFRLALTEEHPTIKPYEEKKWAQLPDVNLPILPSLKILEGLHKRWSFMLENLTAEELKKTYFHPESEKNFTVEETIGMYAHHGNHHLSHIHNLIKIKGWNSKV